MEFEIGDRVECVRETYCALALVKGNKYTITKTYRVSGMGRVDLAEFLTGNLDAARFIRVNGTKPKKQAMGSLDASHIKNPADHK